MAEIPFEINLEITEKAEHNGRFYVKGLASTADIDLVGDIVTPEALESSEDDLLKNSTVFIDHDRKQPIGTVVATKYLPARNALEVTILIPNSEKETQKQIKDNRLNKLSIGAVVLNAEKAADRGTGAMVVRILRMLLKEVSLVRMPANPEARNMAWWIKKGLEDLKGGAMDQGMEKGYDGGMSPEELDKKRKRRGAAMKALREKQNLRLTDLARKADVDPRLVDDLEAGHDIGSVSPENIDRIAKALGTTVTDLEKDDQGEGPGGTAVKKQEATTMGEDTVPAIPAPAAPAAVPAPQVDLESAYAVTPEDLKKVEEGVTKRKDMDARFKQVMFLLEKLKNGPSQQVSSVAKQIEALLNQMVGGEEPYQQAAGEQTGPKMDQVLSTLKTLGESLAGVQKDVVELKARPVVTKAEPAAPVAPAVVPAVPVETVVVVRKSESERKPGEPTDAASLIEKAFEEKDAKGNRKLSSSEAFSLLVRSGNVWGGVAVPALAQS